jgi:hypothetical protein
MHWRGGPGSSRSRRHAAWRMEIIRHQEWRCRIIAVYYLKLYKNHTQGKSKSIDFKTHLRNYKYTKKLLNYRNASKCNSLLSTPAQGKTENYFFELWVPAVILCYSRTSDPTTLLYFVRAKKYNSIKPQQL